MTQETDRELLEYAAKAAGLRGRLKFSNSPVINPTYIDMPGTWNPLYDNSDALWLSVKLRLTIKHDDPCAAQAGIEENQVGAPTWDGKGPWFYKEWNDSIDICAATRRAIVRAAAEIGKAM